MNDGTGLWIVRALLGVVAAGLLWWGASELGFGDSLEDSAEAHALEHHGGDVNKLSITGDVMSELAHLFGKWALAGGAVAAISAVFPYRRLRRKKG